MKIRRKIICIVLVMIFVFFISWFLYVVFSLVGLILGCDVVFLVFFMILELMVKVLVIYNLILYVFLNVRFRIILLNFCRCLKNWIGNGSIENFDFVSFDSVIDGIGIEM